MVPRRRLDRKTRITLATVIVLLLAGPAVALRNCVLSIQEGSTVVAPLHPVNDGLIRLENGTTIHLHSQVLARKLSQWVDAETDAKPAFELADSNFLSRSAEPTSEGRMRIAQLARILAADPKLHAQVVAMNAGSDATRNLAWSRAARIRSELLAQHVAASNVTSPTELSAALDQQPIVGEPGQDSHLLVVISR